MKWESRRCCWRRNESPCAPWFHSTWDTPIWKLIRWRTILSLMKCNLEHLIDQQADCTPCSDTNQGRFQTGGRNCNFRTTMEGSFRRPRISLGSWLSTLQILLRGSCEVLWAMKRKLRLNRTCRRWCQDSTEVKVQVTRNRMILRPRRWLMLNNMSSCNVLTLRWVKTSLAKMILLGRSSASSWNWRWFQRDGYWHGYLSRCRHVWITSTACWRDAAGKYKQHALHPQNHLPPYTRWRNVWPWSWLPTWPKRLPPFSERFWHTRPRSCTMTVRCIYFAPITGCSRFTRNYCTHCPAMLPESVKENDPAVAGHGSQRMPNHPNSGGRRLLALSPVVLQQLQKKEDKYRAELRLGWTRKWL